MDHLVTSRHHITTSMDQCFIEMNNIDDMEDIGQQESWDLQDKIYQKYKVKLCKIVIGSHVKRELNDILIPDVNNIIASYVDISDGSWFTNAFKDPPSVLKDHNEALARVIQDHNFHAKHMQNRVINRLRHVGFNLTADTRVLLNTILNVSNTRQIEAKGIFKISTIGPVTRDIAIERFKNNLGDIKYRGGCTTLFFFARCSYMYLMYNNKYFTVEGSGERILGTVENGEFICPETAKVDGIQFVTSGLMKLISQITSPHV